MIDMFTQRSRIAYFSMEIALRPEIHTYAGGLGILAGDTMRSCADLELPVVFVTLISRAGYLRQSIDAEGRQVEQPDPWEPERWATPLGAKIAVAIEGRDVWVRPWLYRHKGTLGYEIPVLLLDTVLDENAPEDRDICRDPLWRRRCVPPEPGDRAGHRRLPPAAGARLRHRDLSHERRAFRVAGAGTAARASPDERRPAGRAVSGQPAGHAVYDPEIARQRCVFTTHTPVEAGHDRFPYDLVERKLAGTIDISALKAIAGPEGLNMTRLALNLSGYVNGVAKRHAEISQQLFPGYRVHAITNGVHVETWTCESFAQLYQDHFPNWRHEPEVLVRADGLEDAAVWEAHQRAKLDLLSRVSSETGTDLSPDVLTLGFARRMTGYKRLDLMFSNLDRLLALARDHPFQIVIAGKAHPRDEGGKRIIQSLHRYKTELAPHIPIVFLPNYDMDLARPLTSGSDVWLNTPLPPLEASGTSGMKAALNGVLNLGVLDGWWMEACIDGTTGWAIGDANLGTAADDAEDLYRKLEDDVLPLFYSGRARWIWMMKQSISKIAGYFNSQRMMRRYASEAYLR